MYQQKYVGFHYIYKYMQAYVLQNLKIACSFIYSSSCSGTRTAGERKPSLEGRKLFLPCNTDDFPPRISKRGALRCT